MLGACSEKKREDQKEIKETKNNMIGRKYIGDKSVKNMVQLWVGRPV